MFAHQCLHVRIKNYRQTLAGNMFMSNPGGIDGCVHENMKGCVDEWMDE